LSLDTFLAGRYSSTYAAVDTGITEEGYKITLQTFMEVIAESDAYGQSPIDGIFRGGECTAEFTSLAMKTGSLGAYWPYGGALGTLTPVYGPLINTSGSALQIGNLASAISFPQILTAVANTPAAAAGAPTGPATITASQALLKENYPAALLYNSKLKKVPISLRYWPYVASTVTKFFTAA
jgi:hypothetical protein